MLEFAARLISCWASSNSSITASISSTLTEMDDSVRAASIIFSVTMGVSSAGKGGAGYKSSLVGAERRDDGAPVDRVGWLILPCVGHPIFRAFLAIHLVADAIEVQQRV